MDSEQLPVRVPVRNRSRALAFYAALLGTDSDTQPASMLFQFEERCELGALIHLRIGCLDDALEAVWSNGGCVLEPERLEHEIPSSILVMDSEGNRLALSVA